MPYRAIPYQPPARRKLKALTLFTKLVVMALASLSLVACDSATVVSDRSQREAIEAVAILNSYGIEAVAKKETSGKGRYSVEVEKGYRTQANTILWERIYSRESETPFSELIEQRGLIPSSREIESLRIDHAMAVELEEALRAHPGVVHAKAIARINSAKQTGSPSVSVVIQQKRGVDVSHDQLEEIILRSFPGLRKENIQLSIELEENSALTLVNEGVINQDGKVIRKVLKPFLFFLVPEESFFSLALTLFGCIVLVLVASGIGGYWFGYFQGSKSAFEGDVMELSPKSLKLERPKKDN